MSQGQLFNVSSHDGNPDYRLDGPDTSQPDYRSIARRTDPETSQIAAREVFERLTENQQIFVFALSSLGVASTAKEIEQKAFSLGCKFEPDTIRKRAGECVERGWVRVAGTRRCTVSKKHLPATTYEVIDGWNHDKPRAA